MDVVSIPRGDDHRPALLHRAGDAAAADLVVNLHGNPGSPLSPSSPLVDALLPERVDVLRFNYSGLWGNPGSFSASSALDDVAAVLDFVGSDAARERYGLAPERVHLVGYSFGAAIALVTARDDDRVHGAVALAPCDHGLFGRQFADPESPRHAFLQSLLEEIFGEDRPVDQDPAIFRDDLVENADRLAFDADPGRLAQARLLLLGALDDATCPIEEHLLPLYRELRRQGHLKLEAEVFTCGHSFADVRLEVYARIAQWVVEGRPKRKRASA
jgi:pimeloyl-ACP methyl ester carboxylesterase